MNKSRSSGTFVFKLTWKNITNLLRESVSSDIFYTNETELTRVLWKMEI